jgi:MFS family permease
MQRSSLSVASLEASQRFHIDATALASLAVFQLITYAGMQIPAGILLDRFGPRIVIAIGAAIMATGQIFVSGAANFNIAVIGRMLVGIGDACTFISMIRVVNIWTSGKRASKIQQWVATIGQLGQVVSAIPFVALLSTVGWAKAFFTLAGAAFFSAILVIALLSENRASLHQRVETAAVIASLKVNIKRNPVRMGFWTHATTQSLGTVFALLWCVPFVVEAEGYPKQFASLLLTIFTVTNACLGPVIGAIAAKHHDWQKRLIIAAPISAMTAWALVLILPGTAPAWLLIALVVVLGFGGPTSMLAFDYSRRYVAAKELGAANGFVNIGGFLASLVMLGGIGVALDLLNLGHSRATLYSLGHFRIALLLQFVVVSAALVAYLHEARRTLETEGIRE